MSVKRPGRRYIGFRYRPGTASRKEVARAVDSAWLDGRGGGPEGPERPEGPGGPDVRPRLLVCESGSAILVIPTPGSATMRKALERSAAGEPGLRMEPVVTSGTIVTVKQRMGLVRRRRR